MAIAELADGAGMAECGPPIPASVAVLSGVDPRTGSPFVNQIFLALSGGAAAPGEDAWLTIGHVGNAGFVLRDSVEVDELHHPIRIVEQRLIPDTEGPGRYRGASSLLAEYGPIEATTLTVMYASDGTINPARGVRGGGDGAPSKQFTRGLDGELTEAPPAGAVVSGVRRNNRVDVIRRRRLRPTARTRPRACPPRRRRGLGQPRASP